MPEIAGTKIVRYEYRDEMCGPTSGILKTLFAYKDEREAQDTVTHSREKRARERAPGPPKGLHAKGPVCG